MRQRKNTDDPSVSSKPKPKSLGRIFGYLKKKIKDGIEELTSVTHNETQQPPEETFDISSPHDVCPIPRGPRRSRTVAISKPVNITKEYEMLLAIQVEKCFKKVPGKYFKEEFDVEEELVAKTLKDNKQKQFQLSDYLDEVQFNIAELVGAKQPQLLDSLDNMNSMGLEVKVLLDHLGALRKNNQSLSQKLVGRVAKIRTLQGKSETISLTLKALQNLKNLSGCPQKVKELFVRDKSQAMALYNHYLTVHEQYRSLCGCSNKSRAGCQLATLKEHLRVGYQQSFSKTYWNYITQALFYEKEKLSNIFGNKKDFQSMPGMMPGFSLAALLASGGLDESICDEEKYQLVIKENIEEEVKTMIVTGFYACQFQNQGLLSNVAEFMEDFQKDFLSDVLLEIKESFCIDTDNNLVAKSKGIKVLLSQLQPLIQKLKMSKFLKIVSFYSDIMQKVLRRPFSVLHRTVKSLEYKRIQKREHIEVSLSEVVLQTLEFSDSYLTKLIELKQITQEMDLSHFRDLINTFEEWEQFVQEIEENYIKDIVPVSSIIRPGMCELKKLEQLKNKLVGQYFKGLHQNALTKELKSAMEREEWLEVDIDPKYYNTLGYILEGERFVHSKKSLALLNSSLYLGMKPMAKASTTEEFSYFGVTNSQIVIHKRRYRPTSCLLLLLGIIEEYLKINEMNQEMSAEVSSKLLQLLHFYNSYLAQLILNTAALHFNRVGNSITVRHLCLSCHALGLITVLLNALKARLENIQEANKLIESLSSHQKEIKKKIQTLIPYKISQESKLVALSRPGPSQGTQNIVNYLRSTHQTLRQYFQENEVRWVLTADALGKYLFRMLNLKPKGKSEEELFRLELSYFIAETEFLSSSMADYEEIKDKLTKLLLNS